MSEIPRFPVAGEDYPRTWSQFLSWFPSDEACAAYLERLRWPEGFICPRCGLVRQPYRGTRIRLVCQSCRHQATVTAGTLFDKTRTPLKVWMAAAWYLTSQKHGVSALGLQRVLGLGSYQTAWTMLHRFRRAMVRAGREQLKGTVEVDETYIALTDRDEFKPRGRAKGAATKTIVALAVEILEPKGFGRIRLQRVARGSEEYLLPFVHEVVQRGSTVHTDGSFAYRSLAAEGYRHLRTVVGGSDVPAHESMPAVHGVASLLKRWLLGTHHGAVQPAQLDHYLDEFVFRFNRRASRSRGLLFYRLLEQAIATAPLTYLDIASRK